MVGYRVQGNQSEKNNGFLHLKVACGGLSSPAVKLNLTNVKSKKLTRTESAALSKLKKLLKKR